MQLFAHRPIARAKSLAEHNEPEKALHVIDAFIEAKQKALPAKRCSRLEDAIFLRNNIIVPQCQQVSRAKERAPSLQHSVPLGAIIEDREAGRDDVSSLASSYARVSQDSVLRVFMRPEPSVPHARRHPFRPRVRPPQEPSHPPQVQTRPLSGISTSSAFSASSLDAAVVTEAQRIYLHYAPSSTLQFAPRPS